MLSAVVSTASRKRDSRGSLRSGCGVGSGRGVKLLPDGSMFALTVRMVWLSVNASTPFAR